MSVYYHYFTQQLNQESAEFIKFLRLNRQLSFAYIYKLAAHSFSELRIYDKELIHHEMALGHTLCTATIFFLGEMDMVDDWFWY
jgi:hypothetical protein